jgi:hypothetical protein
MRVAVKQRKVLASNYKKPKKVVIYRKKKLESYHIAAVNMLTKYPVSMYFKNRLKVIRDYLLLMFYAVLRGETWVIPYSKKKVLFSLKVARVKILPSDTLNTKIKISRLMAVKNTNNEMFKFKFFSIYGKNNEFKASLPYRKKLTDLVTNYDMSYVYPQTREER